MSAPLRSRSWHQRHPPVAIPLTLTERMFMLHRLAQVSSVADALIQTVGPFQFRRQWERPMVVEHTRRLVRLLRTREGGILAGTELDRRLIAEAIEGNTYFVVPTGDRRLVLAHIRQAEALRIKLERAIGQKIRRFRIGEPDA
jgi:hypothetical protein